MTLHDRIAAVLASIEVVLDGDNLNETSTFLLADAVIAALGLRQETVGLIHRWVTNWTDPAPPAPRRLWDIFAEADEADKG